MSVQTVNLILIMQCVMWLAQQINTYCQVITVSFLH